MIDGDDVDNDGDNDDDCDHNDCNHDSCMNFNYRINMLSHMLQTKDLNVLQLFSNITNVILVRNESAKVRLPRNNRTLSTSLI